MPEPVALGTVLPRIMDQAAQHHRAIHQIQRRWASLVGRSLAAHTRPVSLRRGTLYVRTDEPGASFLVSLEKPKLLRRLSEAVGQQVDEIVVTAGEVT